MPKAGQRITDNPKGNIVQVRMDDKTIKALDYLASGGVSRSAVIRDGIWMQYEQDQKARKRRNGTMGMLIKGLDEACELVTDPAVQGERFAVFFNDISDCVVLEESASHATIDMFEKDGLRYCGDIIGRDDISEYDIRELIEETISE